MGEFLNTKQKPLYKDPVVIVIIVLVFILLCRVLFAFNYRGVIVDGSSMKPTLNDGDFLYISLSDTPDYGDIVVLEKDDGVKIIKRVIAMGGDTVYMDKGDVYIMYSGTDEYVLLDEDYVAETNNYPINKNYVVYTTEPLFVEEGCLYVLGDNRADSADSRKYGCFSLSQLTGVVTSWSLKYKSFLTAVHI